MNNNLKLSENAIESILLESGISREKTDTCVRVFQHMAIFSDMERLEPVNKGMTNRLFFFAAGGKEYLLRVAGEGSEYLVDRMQEHWIYHKLQSRHITDPYVYMNPETGIKITEYIANARTCDSGNWEDVRRCMDHLARFHRLNVQGQVYFDLYEKLEEYQRVCQHDISEYFPDYPIVKDNVLKLKTIIEGSPRSYCICHVDPVPDNFLIQGDKIYLIDWEYAAMADPHMDIAMFCIYAGYDRTWVDRVIDCYFSGGCPDAVRRKIYCYVAVSGLLWTVWCEIKRDSDVLFEEYEKVQYQYARDFYRYVMEWEETDEK